MTQNTNWEDFKRYIENATVGMRELTGRILTAGTLEERVSEVGFIAGTTLRMAACLVAVARAADDAQMRQVFLNSGLTEEELVELGSISVQSLEAIAEVLTKYQEIELPDVLDNSE